MKGRRAFYDWTSVQAGCANGDNPCAANGDFECTLTNAANCTDGCKRWKAMSKSFGC